MILRDKKRGVVILLAPILKGEEAYLDATYKRVEPGKLLWWLGEPREPPKPMEGLGDLVARATQAVGLKSCEPCKKRQATLNRWVPFRRKKSNGS